MIIIAHLGCFLADIYVSGIKLEARLCRQNESENIQISRSEESGLPANWTVGRESNEICSLLRNNSCNNLSMTLDFNSIVTEVGNGPKVNCFSY